MRLAMERRRALASSPAMVLVSRHQTPSPTARGGVGTPPLLEEFDPAKTSLNARELETQIVRKT